MSKALYRKYRSKKLDEVVGQKHVTDILSRALAAEQISHAYLLTGPRGVGKTSVARILAHEINKLPYNDEEAHLDIIEIDAASNNGVEDIRDLREKVQIAPFSADKKIYIIDEVHMLSKSAFNALLKTLEEPPIHVVFILATTNIEKLPATIISRTQRYSFRPIGTDDTVKHLAKIAKAEKIKITEDALKLIAERSEGSFRDSISLLDQLSSLGTDKEITTDTIEDILGMASHKVIEQILDAVEKKEIKSLVATIDKTINEGVDASILVTQLTSAIRAQIIDKPQLLSLLDALIEVPKSPQPELKLLSVLGFAALPKAQVKSAALLAPPQEVSATIAELEEKAAQDRLSEKTSQSSKEETQNVKPEAKKIRKQRPAAEFDWSKLIEYTRQNYVALYSVLSKCGHQLESETLTLYTNSKFYKKKLDDIKYSSLLSKCLQEIGTFGLDVHTIPTSIPPKDSAAAAVAAIMGGGEEVSVESL